MENLRILGINCLEDELLWIEWGFFPSTFSHVNPKFSFLLKFKPTFRSIYCDHLQGELKNYDKSITRLVISNLNNTYRRKISRVIHPSAARQESSNADIALNEKIFGKKNFLIISSKALEINEKMYKKVEKIWWSNPGPQNFKFNRSNLFWRIESPGRRNRAPRIF